MKIDRLTAHDAERLRSIRLRALGDAPDAFATTLDQVAAQPMEAWKSQLNALATFVAIVQNRDAGLARGAPHDRLPDAGYLLSMWVAPEARRQGVGSALVQAVVDWARSLHLARLILDVGTANTPAIALYTRLGFVPNGVVGTLPPPREHMYEMQLVREL